jgi:tetratricopeptide (TPR) repeat protein
MAMTYDLLAQPYRYFLFDELEDYELAIKTLTDCLKNDPRNGVAYNNRGLAHSEIGHAEEALHDFALAIECSPIDPLPYVNRADLYLRAKPEARLQEAIEDFTHAIALNSNNATFHRCRAHACLKANRLQDAVDSFSIAIQLEPDFRQTYIDRGKIYQQIGEDEKAKQDFDMASTLPPYPARK